MAIKEEITYFQNSLSFQPLRRCAAGYRQTPEDYLGNDLASCSRHHHHQTRNYHLRHHWCFRDQQSCDQHVELCEEEIQNKIMYNQESD